MYLISIRVGTPRTGRKEKRKVDGVAFGGGVRTFHALPGGKLVNHLGCEFALATGETPRVTYPDAERNAAGVTE